MVEDNCVCGWYQNVNGYDSFYSDFDWLNRLYNCQFFCFQFELISY